MSIRLLQPFLPNRKNAAHPRLLECLLDLTNRPHCLNTLILMLQNLHESGQESRFVVALTGIPVFELKSMARGGEAGGARVYFFWTNNHEAILVNAECKRGKQSNPQLIVEVLQCIQAYRKGLLRFYEGSR